MVTTNRFRILDQSSDSEQFVYRKRRLETNNTVDNVQASSTFDQILPAHSAAIYREFQAGRVLG